MSKDTAVETETPETVDTEAQSTDAGASTPGDERLEEANSMVKTHVLAAMATSLVPIPIFDMAALTGVQLKLLYSLSKLYEIKFTKDMGKSVISSLIGAIIPAMGAVTASSMMKGVPGVGTATGMISMSVFGGAATYAVGKVFIQHFESGGTFLTFDPEAVRQHFKEEFERGKKEAAAMKEGTETA